MLPQITGFYVGLSALLLLGLAILVVRERIRNKVSLGDGDGAAPALRRASRAFGNTAEYLPMLLLLLAAIEASGAPVWVTHLFGFVMVAARLGHAVAITWNVIPLRQLTMLATFAALGFGGLGVIGHSLLGSGS